MPDIVTQKVNITANTTAWSGAKETPAYNGTSLFITKIMNGIKNLVTTEEVVRKTEPPLPLCPQIAPELGKINIIYIFRPRYLREMFTM